MRLGNMRKLLKNISPDIVADAILVKAGALGRIANMGLKISVYNPWMGINMREIS